MGGAELVGQRWGGLSLWDRDGGDELVGQRWGG